jgi:hypothetical protein
MLSGDNLSALKQVGPGTRPLSYPGRLRPVTEPAKRVKEQLQMKTWNSTSIGNNNQRKPIIKRTMRPLLALVGIFLAGAVANAQAMNCSNATLHGAYGMSLGTILVPPLGMGTPRGVLGRIVFDGKGSYSAAFTINTNGTVTHTTDVGPYVVNGDCTGVIFSNAVKGTVEIVVVDGGKEFYQLRTDPAGVVVMFNAAKKQLPGEKNED